KVTAARLEKQGIKTCADVRSFDIFQFVHLFGQFGEHIHKLAHGIDNRPVVSAWRRKSVSVENTYEQDLPDLPSCTMELPPLLEALQKRIDRLDDDYRVQNCFIKMKFHDFTQTTVERQNTSVSLHDFTTLCEQAWQRGRIPVRLLGIGVKLNDLTESGGQLELFDTLECGSNDMVSRQRVIDRAESTVT
ncbi:MAG: DNA polymerase IV, partial [Gammaproteobacteria bacterium]|nr:DNA polymerase IV [Gammaproteobacteria bacterium]